MKNITGFTFIELLIALTISILLISYLGVVFIAAQKNYHMQASLNKSQEDLRSLMVLLNSDIHLVGDVGCARLTDDFPIYNNTSIKFSPKNKLAIYLDEHKKPDTNGLTVVRMESSSSSLVKPMRGYLNLYVTDGEYEIGDMMMISDCQRADLFSIKSIENLDGMVKIVANAPLSKKYSLSAMVGKFLKNSYFIALSEDIEMDQSSHSLFLKDINGDVDEVVKGVDDMKIEFDKKDRQIVGVDVQLTMSILGDKKTYHIYSAVN